MSLPNDEPFSATAGISAKSGNRDRLMLDVITSYALAGARVGSWLIVSGLVARTFGSTMFALLALIRLTMTPVSYAGLNLGPAVVRCVSTWLRTKENERSIATVENQSNQMVVLEYASPTRPEKKVESPWYIATHVTFQLIVLLVCVGLGLSWLFSHVLLAFPDNFSSEIHFNRTAVDSFFAAAMILGFALAIRSATEGFAGLLQIRYRLWYDNAVAIIAECGFVALCSVWINDLRITNGLVFVTGMFALSVSLLAFIRALLTVTKSENRAGFWPSFVTDRKLTISLLITGGTLTAAQLADYFYAPFALQLASRTFTTTEIAGYSASLMIDAALLLLIAGIATPLLARVTHAHIDHQLTSIRRIYIRASVTAFAILLMGSLAIWAASDLLLKLWLKDVPVGVASILPLVLIHTTIGGASGVGRAVLIGMGKIRAWTISSLIGGVSNALLVLLFVLLFEWGVRGIVFATIISVTLRCLIWMPWYILRATKQFADSSKVVAPMADS